jgi:DNA-directed RNA polymerase subunit RPC12/RpoP
MTRRLVRCSHCRKPQQEKHWGPRRGQVCTSCGKWFEPELPSSDAKEKTNTCPKCGKRMAFGADVKVGTAMAQSEEIVAALRLLRGKLDLMVVPESFSEAQISDAAATVALIASNVDDLIVGGEALVDVLHLTAHKETDVPVDWPVVNGWLAAASALVKQGSEIPSIEG